MSASSRQPLDVMLAEMLEGCDYGTSLYNRLTIIQRLVGEERLANMGKLAAAVPSQPLAEGPYVRVKHLLYFLLDYLKIGELEEVVAQTVQALHLGGVVMRNPLECLVIELAQKLDGPRWSVAAPDLICHCGSEMQPHESGWVKCPSCRATRAIAPNLVAILSWVDEHRPDLSAVVREAMGNDNFLLLLAVGFEAGKADQFQQNLRR